MPSTEFISTGYHVPDRVITNEALTEWWDTSDEWIRERTGIERRHWVEPGKQADLVIIDARKLSTEHLGILNPPKYLSRLMQTLEPAFEQLIRIQVLGAYHTIAAEEWRIALRRHPAYVPERKTLVLHSGAHDPALDRAERRSGRGHGGWGSRLPGYGPDHGSTARGED